MKTKSWQQCCDEVLKLKGVDKHDLNRFQRQEPEAFQFFKEAAELYREEGIREAIELARGYVFGLDDQIKKEIINRLKA